MKNTLNFDQNHPRPPIQAPPHGVHYRTLHDKVAIWAGQLGDKMKKIPGVNKLPGMGKKKGETSRNFFDF